MWLACSCATWSCPAAAQVEQTLVDAQPGWLATLSTAAQERGEGLAARVGVEAGVGSEQDRTGDGSRVAPAGARPGRRVVLEPARRSTCPP